MNDVSDLIKVFKTIVKDTVNAGDPTNWVYGEVVSINPLKIKIDQKIILEEIQLTLSRNVTEWTENIEINWITGDNTHTHPFSGDGSVQDNTHNHKLEGVYQIKHLTKLAVGERVVLIQAQGGQHYLVLDRV